MLGFVGGGGVQSQRIFITNAQVQPWDYVSGCIDQKVPNNPDSLKWWVDIGFLPWASEYPPPTAHMSYKTCVDCTLTGTNIKPLFW